MTLGAQGALEELPWLDEWSSWPKGTLRVFHARRACTHLHYFPPGIHAGLTSVLKVSSSRSRFGSTRLQGVDTGRGWELRRLFGHVCRTADVAKVLKNESMIADLVGRVEGGRLAEQDVLPSRTSWNK